MQGASCDLQEYFVIRMNKSVFGNRKDFTLVHIFFINAVKFNFMKPY